MNFWLSTRVSSKALVPFIRPAEQQACEQRAKAMEEEPRSSKVLKIKQKVRVKTKVSVSGCVTTEHVIGKIARMITTL